MKQTNNADVYVLLAELEDIAEVKRLERIAIKKRQLIELAEAEAETKLRYDLKIMELLEAGASVSAICRAAGTTNRNSVYEVRERMSNGEAQTLQRQRRSPLDIYYSIIDGGLIHVSYPKPYGYKGLSGEATVKYMPYVDNDGIERDSFNTASNVTAPQINRWMTSLSRDGQDGYYRDELAAWLASKGYKGVAGAEALALGADSAGSAGDSF